MEKKKTGLSKIIMFVLLGAVIASWIFSASYYEEGKLAELGMNNVGLFDAFSLFIKSFCFDYFLQITFLLLSVGALYGVLDKTGKYRAWIERIVRNFKGREFLFIVIVSFAITLITSVFDYGYALLIFFPLLISILLAMGYDKVTVIAATFGAILIGTIGNTIGSSTSGAIAELLNGKATDGFYFKLALLLISYVALLLFLSKAKRRKVTEEQLEKIDMFIGEKNANKYSITPIITIFIILFGLLVLGLTNWEKTFGNPTMFYIFMGLSIISFAIAVIIACTSSNNNIFKALLICTIIAIIIISIYSISNDLLNNKPIMFYILMGLSIVSLLAVEIYGYISTNNNNKIIGLIITSVIAIIVIALCIVKMELLKNLTFEGLHTAITEFSPKLPYLRFTSDGFEYGTEKIEIFGKLLGDITAFGTWFYSEIAIMCFFASLIIAKIYKVKYLEAAKDGAKKMFKPALVLLLSYTVIYFAGNQMFYPTIAKLLLSITNKFSVVISSICMALSTLLHVDILYVTNYTVPQLAEKASDTTLVALLSQSIYGLTLFVAPTSGMLVLGLEYLGVPYKEWIKRIWKLVVALLVIVLAVLLIAKYI